MALLLPVRRVDQCRGDFFPVGSRSEPFEVKEAAAVEPGVGDLNDAAKPYQGPFIDFIPAEQVSVVTKIPEEPVELPQRLGSRIQPTRNRSAGIFGGFEDT